MSASNTLPIYHVFISVNEQLHHKNIYDMLELYKSGKITKETYVWKIDMEKK